MPPTDPTARLLAARLLEVLGGVDLTSADGRAGIGTLLSEIERLSPGAILQQAAGSSCGEWGERGGRRSKVPLGEKNVRQVFSHPPALWA